MIKEFSENKIKNWLISSTLTLVSVYALILGIVETYYSDVISVRAALIIAIPACLILCALFTFVPKYGFVGLGLGIITAVIIYYDYKRYLYGVCSIMNVMIFKFAHFFQVELSCVDMNNLYYVEDALFYGMYAILAVISMVFSFCIARQKALCIPFVVNAMGLAIPIILNTNISVMITTLQIAALIATICMCVSVVMRSRVANNRDVAMTVAGIMTVFVLLAGFVLSKATPMDEGFERPVFWDGVYTWSVATGKEIKASAKENAMNIAEEIAKGGNIVTFFRDHNIKLPFQNGNAGGLPSVVPSDIAAGNLGHLDSLGASGSDVLFVTVDREEGRVYLKGYVAKDYFGKNTSLTNAHWEAMSETTYQQSAALWEDEGFYAQNSLARFEYLLSETGGQGKFIRVEDLLSRTSSTFMPVYPTFIYDTQMVTDGCYRNVDGEISYSVFHRSDVIELAEMLAEDSYLESPYFLHMSQSSLKSIFAMKQGELQYREFAYEQYLEVNTDAKDYIEEELQRLLETYDITKEDLATAVGRYCLADGVREYLSQFPYTKSPGRLPDDKDFVEYFLTEAKEGYCTYYASTAVMFLRAAGIPARYVEGYAFNTKGEQAAKEITKRSDNRTTYGVSDADAHAWIEFYIDGLGWVDYEVTPGMEVASEIGQIETEPETTTPEETTTEQDSTDEGTTTEQDSTDEETTTEEDTTTEKENSTTGEQTTEAPTTKDDATTSESADGSSPEEGPTIEKPVNPSQIISKKGFRIALAIVFGALALGGILLVLKASYRRKYAYYYVTLEGEEKDLEAILLLNYERYERILKYIGIKHSPTEDFMEFAQRVAKQTDAVDRTESEFLSEIYEQVIYAKTPVTESDVMKVCRTVDCIAERMDDCQGVLRKFIYRYLLVLKR